MSSSSEDGGSSKMESTGAASSTASSTARLAQQLRRRAGAVAAGGAAGWCPCLTSGADEPPEITYCVVDGAGTLNLQAVTPAIPMPDEEELNLKFAELVVSIYLVEPLFVSSPDL